MKIFKHVSNTWFLAHLLHPIVFYGYFLLVLKDPMDFEALLSLFVGALIVSLPSFLLCQVFIHLVLLLPLAIIGRFFSWVLLSFASILINIIFLGLLLGDNLINQTDGKFFIPSFIATFLAILFRYRFFHELVIVNNRQRDEEGMIGSYD